MKIGVVAEIKPQEYRVGLTPAGIRAIMACGHEVLVQRGAGEASGFEDEQYLAVGARRAPYADDVFAEADMVVKVKEPQPSECEMLRPGQILFTYLHLAADEQLTRRLMDSRAKAVAYETIQLSDGSLPCLRPMSEIAGRLSVQAGAHFLERPRGGRGVLLGGVPGVRPGKVTILGGGVSGTNACRMAVGLGAQVTVFDVQPSRLAYLDDLFAGRITTLYCDECRVVEAIAESDLVIGAVLVPGAKAPVVIRHGHLEAMKRGSVIVDVAVDQGGCAETTHPTTHDDPVFVVDGVVHYCVANMPGAVAMTSTEALTSTTLPYVLLIAQHGLEEACRLSPPLARGVNVFEGQCVNEQVAVAHGLAAIDLDEALQTNRSEPCRTL